MKAAWHAAQVAIRQLTVDGKNSTITETVGKVAAQWDCKPVEGQPDGSAKTAIAIFDTVHWCPGMLSCQFEQNMIDGKKRIIQNPSSEQKGSHEKCTFAENEVYGIDVLVSSHTDGKVSMNLRSSTSVKTLTYFTCAVPHRRSSDHSLPADQRYDLPAEAEDVTSCDGGGDEEGRLLPIQRSLIGG